jgi:feruloyl esterase
VYKVSITADLQDLKDANSIVYRIGSGFNGSRTNSVRSRLGDSLDLFSLHRQPSSACEALARLNLPNTTITTAEEVAAGAFAPPAGKFTLPAPPGAPTPYGGLPPFCRVAGTIAPVPESAIGFEVWLPNTWNGKFVGIGNGGASGLIFYSDMAEPLSRGYAVAATDTGHSGGLGDWSFAVDREKFIDFGYRAIHEMTLKSKAVVEARYGTAAMRSYWNGCSSGGRQGLTTAHRFPEDYDGIIARAPAIKLGFNRFARPSSSKQWRIPSSPSRLPS